MQRFATFGKSEDLVVRRPFQCLIRLTILERAGLCASRVKHWSLCFAGGFSLEPSTTTLLSGLLGLLGLAHHPKASPFSTETQTESPQ